MNGVLRHLIVSEIILIIANILLNCICINIYSKQEISLVKHCFCESIVAPSDGGHLNPQLLIISSSSCYIIFFSNDKTNVIVSENNSQYNPGELHNFLQAETLYDKCIGN